MLVASCSHPLGLSIPQIECYDKMRSRMDEQDGILKTDPSDERPVENAMFLMLACCCAHLLEYIYALIFILYVL